MLWPSADPHRRLKEVRRGCEASVDIAAPPSAVWAVVADVTRVGEWSGEWAMLRHVLVSAR